MITAEQKLERIRLALWDYHHAVDNRQTAGLALANLQNEVAQTLDSYWSEGCTLCMPRGAYKPQIVADAARLFAQHYGSGPEVLHQNMAGPKPQPEELAALFVSSQPKVAAFLSGAQQQRADGSWGPAEPIPLQCEHDNCPVTGAENLRKYKAIPDPEDDPDDGWADEPAYLCDKHGAGRELYVRPYAPDVSRLDNAVQAYLQGAVGDPAQELLDRAKELGLEKQ